MLAVTEFAANMASELPNRATNTGSASGSRKGMRYTSSVQKKTSNATALIGSSMAIWLGPGGYRTGTSATATTR